MPQKFVNLENLTSFWGNAKEYIDNERKEIEDQLYNWQKTEKAPIVQCEPVPNSELHPVVDFSFSEMLPDGDKTPTNPSTIMGVSSISVTRCGKNLIPQYPDITERTIGGVKYKYNGDGSYTINGTANGSNSLFYIRSTGMGGIRLHAGETYSLSGAFSSDIRLGTRVENTDKYDLGSGLTFTAASDFIANCYIMVTNGTTVNNVIIKPQYELGSAATSFELYAGTDYAIDLGSTYYGGSIDLATGLMTVTWRKINVESFVNVQAVQTNCIRLAHVYSVNGYWHYSADYPQYFACEKLPVIENLSPDSEFARAIGGGSGYSAAATFSILKTRFDVSSAVDPSNPTNTEWLAAGNAWLANNPLSYYVKLSTPFTVQLTPQQIKSLPSLEGTSKRINIIYADTDSIQVEYQKYVGIDSTLDSDSVNAVQNKIINSALNTKVSLSGDETINGTKTFSNTINGNITGDAGTVAGHIVSKDVPVNAAFTDTTYDPATQSTAGLMSAFDKVKLDAVGSVFSFKGSVIDDTYLPASDNVNGDAYLAEDTGHVHVYDGTSFVDIGVWAGIPSATDAQIDALFED